MTEVFRDALMNIELMRRRAHIVQTIRNFFINAGYLEVDTPALSPTVIPESSIEVFETRLRLSTGHSSTLHLVPSPEIWMKRLLAAGSGSIFQLAKSFRNGEESAGYHNPEFLMLEWYTVDADYLDSILTCEKLFRALLETEEVRQLAPPFRRMSIEQAFHDFAGLDLAGYATEYELRSAAESIGISCPPDDSWAEIYNRIFISNIEPQLPQDKPLVLFDYPSKISCLAKPVQGTPWCERWELYASGVEIANCYSEETDPERISAFVESECNELGMKGREVQVDRRFHEIFHPEFPRCSGAALGADRLIMLLTGTRSISEIIYFPFE